MTEEKNAQVANDLVVAIDYVLTVDGEVLDSSEEEGPLEYLHGHNNIIPGLEKEITGMKVKESKHVDVSPEGGYGLVEEEAILDVPLEEFPEDVPLEPGIELEVTDNEGDMMFARIKEVGSTSVKLDTNHPLAGKTLHFDVTVVGLRAPSKEELDHGHVHYGHGDH
ncbi:MAG: peptidylprolyl isomerase [Anaerolineales bacterium]|jgi:FKBP-type peptidyl-prolyl cis-trans isomerase SlyD